MLGSPMHRIRDEGQRQRRENKANERIKEKQAWERVCHSYDETLTLVFLFHSRSVMYISRSSYIMRFFLRLLAQSRIVIAILWCLFRLDAVSSPLSGHYWRKRDFVQLVFVMPFTLIQCLVVSASIVKRLRSSRMWCDYTVSCYKRGMNNA